MNVPLGTKGVDIMNATLEEAVINEAGLAGECGLAKRDEKALVRGRSDDIMMCVSTDNMNVPLGTPEFPGGFFKLFS